VLGAKSGRPLRICPGNVTDVSDTTTGVVLQPVDLDSPQLHAWMVSVSRGLKDSHRVPIERVEMRRPAYRAEGHRLTAALDGDQVVGTFRSWDLDLTVPGGGTLRGDAISSVSVQPTHRRRGILTRMMTADLAAAAERGVPVAVLIASEAGIYGRYGFGVATEAVTWTLDLPATHLRPDTPDDPGNCRIVEATDLKQIGPQVYLAARTPGAIDRSDFWWDLTLGITPYPGEEAKHHVGVVHHDGDGAADGYLVYRVEENRQDRTVQSVVHVADLVTASTWAYRALWRYLAELDLVTTVRAEDRPVDELLPWLLTDHRAARQSARCDFEWTRVLDPVATLSGRRYQAPGECVIEVSDPHGWAAGRFLLEVEPDGTGRCTRTARPAEIGLTVQALSGLWLGGGDLGGALLSGQAVEHRTGSGVRLATLLHTSPAPWTSTWF
jgi:predicted acetyltransferase